MAKCSECGFLAVWERDRSRFEEASEYFRDKGHPENIQDNEGAFHAKCFIRQYDLMHEFWNYPWPELAGGVRRYSAAIKGIIAKDRNCAGFTSWMQGVSPKELREMTFQEELRKAERRHANISLAVAVIGVLIAAAATYFSANLGAHATRESAKLQVEALKDQTMAQMEMTKMQINAQLESAKMQIEAAKMAPAPKVILRMPPAQTK